MAETLLLAVVWLIAIGLVLFVLIYALLRPWHDPMGRHIILFMLALAVAFLYAVAIAPHLSSQIRVHGWIAVLGFVMFVVWWRLIILVRGQIKNQEALYDLLVKIKRKITRK